MFVFTQQMAEHGVLSRSSRGREVEGEIRTARGVDSKMKEKVSIVNADFFFYCFLKKKSATKEAILYGGKTHADEG